LLAVVPLLCSTKEREDGGRRNIAKNEEWRMEEQLEEGGSKEMRELQTGIYA
jgi:hypothetical protein